MNTCKFAQDIAQKGDILFMGMLTVREVANRTNSAITTVHRWIKSGELKAKKEGTGKRGSHNGYLINEEDLNNFVENHVCRPKLIVRNSKPINRVPDLEDCYPVNLVRAVLQEHEMPDGFHMDFLKVNYKLFREMITRLTDRQQRMIEMRYHIGATLDECGKAFGITRQRANLIEHTAIERLRLMMQRTSVTMIPKAEYNDLLRENENLKNEIENLQAQLFESDSDEKTKAEIKEKLWNEKMNTRIEDLDLTVRAYNCLKRYFGVLGYRDVTVGMLVRFDTDQDKPGIDINGLEYYKTWYDIRNAGSRSIRDIATAVFIHCGYRLRIFNTKTKKYVAFVDIPGVPQTMTELKEVEA